MVRTPFAEVRVETEGHHAGCVSVAVRRKFLDGNLGLGGLKLSSERHQHGRPSDGRVEHLDESLLAGDVRILHIREHLVLQRLAWNVAEEWIRSVHCSYGGFCIVSCSGAVDEAALEVGNHLAVVEHPHLARVGDIGDVCDFDVLLVAVSDEFFLVRHVTILP